MSLMFPKDKSCKHCGHVCPSDVWESNTKMECMETGTPFCVCEDYKCKPGCTDYRHHHCTRSASYREASHISLRLVCENESKQTEADTNRQVRVRPVSLRDDAINLLSARLAPASSLLRAVRASDVQEDDVPCTPPRLIRNNYGSNHPPPLPRRSRTSSHVFPFVGDAYNLRNRHSNSPLSSPRRP